MAVSSRTKDAGREGERQFEAFMDGLDKTSQQAVRHPLTPVARPQTVTKKFWGGGIPK